MAWISNTTQSPPCETWACTPRQRRAAPRASDMAAWAQGRRQRQPWGTSPWRKRGARPRHWCCRACLLPQEWGLREASWLWRDKCRGKHPKRKRNVKCEENHRGIQTHRCCWCLLLRSLVAVMGRQAFRGVWKSLSCFQFAKITSRTRDGRHHAILFIP